MTEPSNPINRSNSTRRSLAVSESVNQLKEPDSSTRCSPGYSIPLNTADPAPVSEYRRDIQTRSVFSVIGPRDRICAWFKRGYQWSVQFCVSSKDVFVKFRYIYEGAASNSGLGRYSRVRSAAEDH